jgi:predicted N-formylglutamate amidohydrolase
MTSFSKLLIDPSQHISCDNLVRMHLELSTLTDTESSPEKRIASMNHEISQPMLSDRMNSFYMVYHNVLSELIWFLRPSLVLNIHSHPAEHLSGDVVIYSSREKLASELS